MQRGPRDTGLMKKFDCFECNKRRLLRGLCNNAISRGKCPGDLAGEYRERKIPRANTNEHSATAHAQFISLTGRAGQQPGRKYAPRLTGIVTTIVRSFAHFRKAIVDCFATLILQERNQAAAIFLDKIASAFECRRPVGDGRCLPRRKSGASRG